MNLAGKGRRKVTPSNAYSSNAAVTTDAAATAMPLDEPTSIFHLRLRRQRAGDHGRWRIGGLVGPYPETVRSQPTTSLAHDESPRKKEKNKTSTH